VTVFVAGGGINETSAYPVISRTILEDGQVEYDATIDEDSKTNLDRIIHCFETLLFWYPGQVEKTMELWPPLRSYPATLLEERIRFLLAPLPDDSVLQQANVTEDIDWPKLFFCDNRGAGMSVAQVSHALQTLPEPLLLRLNYDAYMRQQDDNEHENEQFDDQQQMQQQHSSMTNPKYASMVASMYERTPSVVTQMTHSVLDLWVTGVSNLDVISLSFLHWQGWDWQACRIVLHAFPSCQRCSLEPSWELLERGRSTKGTRKRFMASSLSYLQIRLQLRPWHIFAMMKTHARLSGYSASHLKRNLDFLQEKLQLRSGDLRKLVLLMPSLLGASVDALDARLVFWLEKVGLSIEQLQDALGQKPALLHYSVSHNLQPKLDFFSGELKLDPLTLRKMTLAVPELWCRSEEKFLRPLVDKFTSECGDLSFAEFGQILAQVPQLLRYSSVTMPQKLRFIKDRLGLTGDQIKPMIQTAPRVLLQSIPTTLEPKIEMIESVSGSAYRDILQSNPSLLTLSRSKLKASVQRADTDGGESIAVALAQPSKGKRRRKEIWMLSESREVKKKFSCVSEAARHANTSEPNMYNAVKNGRVLKGRLYVYAQTNTPAVDEFVDYASQMKGLLQEGAVKSASNITHLTIHTSGRAFPPEDTVRGRRRAGGMALQVLSWSPDEWRRTCANIWRGRRLRLLADGQTVILGYPFLRPSRPRCSLYACEEALRVASQFAKMSSPDTLQRSISIVTDSGYVFGLLQNTTQVLEWGLAETKDDFLSSWDKHPQSCELHQANPDILYPLSRLCYQMVEKSNKVVSLRFLSGNLDDNARRLRDGARLAAKLMYDSTR